VLKDMGTINDWQWKTEEQ